MTWRGPGSSERLIARRRHRGVRRLEWFLRDTMQITRDAVLFLAKYMCVWGKTNPAWHRGRRSTVGRHVWNRGCMFVKHHFEQNTTSEDAEFSAIEIPNYCFSSSGTLRRPRFSAGTSLKTAIIIDLWKLGLESWRQAACLGYLLATTHQPNTPVKRIGHIDAAGPKE